MVLSMDDLDVLKIRKDFPILTRKMNNKTLVYLDSASTSQKPKIVIDSEREYYEKYNSGVDRGIYNLSVTATRKFEEARSCVSEFFGAQENEIIWTSSATEGINLLTYAVLNLYFQNSKNDNPLILKKNHEILITEIEHHSNLIPWQELCKRTNIKLRYLPVRLDGTFDLRKIVKNNLINKNTKIIAFTHISNVLGIVNPVSEIVKLAKKFNAITILDACQSAPHIPINLKLLNVDFAVISGHKMLAPTGIGILYGKEKLLKLMPSCFTGGGMVNKVNMYNSEYLEVPKRFEAGTKQISQAIAFSEAVKYLKSIGMQAIHNREKLVGKILREELIKIPKINFLERQLNNSREKNKNIQRISLVSFFIEDIHPHDIGQFLDYHGIAVRVGNHCAQILHKKFRVHASIRVSPYIYNTFNEIEKFIKQIKNACKFFMS